MQQEAVYNTWQLGTFHTADYIEEVGSLLTVSRMALQCASVSSMSARLRKPVLQRSARRRLLNLDSTRPFTMSQALSPPRRTTQPGRKNEG